MAFPHLLSVVFSSLDPACNLALEEYLLTTLGDADSPARESDGLFLLWRNGPSVIVGRHQNTVEEVNSGFVQERGIPVIRRMTGGGAVYHDEGNLNFSFLVKAGAVRPDASLFAEFLHPVITALADLGVKAELSGRNDITTGGSKISGSAMRRTSSALLLHGTILVDLNMGLLGDILAGNPDKYTSKGIQSHRSRVTNLREFLPSGWTPERRMEELSAALIRRCAMGRAIVGENVMQGAQELARRRYRTWEWNYGASPAFTEKKRRRFSFGAVEACFVVEGGVVRDCRIFGDFFAENDVRNLETAVCGIQYSRDALRTVLENQELSTYFVGCAQEEMLAFFLD